MRQICYGCPNGLKPAKAIAEIKKQMVERLV
jgi:succinate dehydrogenase/fumarate reductase-like Fe-S protein